MSTELYMEMIPVPGTTRFPVELRTPPGFDPEDPATWPRVDGRMEWVGGRLLYMPLSGDRQAKTTLGVAGVLDRWLDEHDEYEAGTNEPGIIFRPDVRGADAAVWLSSEVGPDSGGYRRIPPILAVEVAGRDEGEAELRQKAAWYLERGVKVVWVILPATREALVLTPGAEARYTPGHHIAAHPDLPGLTPDVALFFRRLS